jgi:hypothetical protein
MGEMEIRGWWWVEWFAGAILKNTQHTTMRGARGGPGWSSSYRSDVARRFIPGRLPAQRPSTQSAPPPTRIHIPAACRSFANHPPATAAACTAMHVMHDDERKAAASHAENIRFAAEPTAFFAALEK